MVFAIDNSGEDYTAVSSMKAEQHRRLRKRIARAVRTDPLCLLPLPLGLARKVRGSIKQISDMWLAPMQYSMTTVLNYEPIIDRNINDLLSWFKKIGTLDISEWTHYFTLDSS